MYVCLCNGHRDHEIKALAAQGIGCARQAYAALGGEPQCGLCLETAQQIIDQTQESDVGPQASHARAPAHSFPAR